MNELTFEEMHSFMDFAWHRERNGKGFPVGLEGFKEIFLRINSGCPCTKSNREQHAEVTYKNTMLMLAPLDQHELKDFLGVGEEYSVVTIKNNGAFLLELTAESS